MNANTTFFRRIATSKVSLLTALVLAAAGASQPAAAGANDTQMALTCIGTETGSTIVFQYRWGSSGEWHRTTVEPGVWKALSYRYDYPGENRSPRLEVRFDDDLTSGFNLVSQKLNSFAARDKRCEAEGATYNFIARSGELFLSSGNR